LTSIIATRRVSSRIASMTRCGLDDAAARRRHDGHLAAAARERRDGFSHRGMLDRGCDNVMTSALWDRAENRGVVRLGATAREDDLPRGGGQQPRHGLACIFDQPSRRLAFFMNG
jgi:hypothetical protein